MLGGDPMQARNEKLEAIAQLADDIAARARAIPMDSVTSWQVVCQLEASKAELCQVLQDLDNLTEDDCRNELPSRPQGTEARVCEDIASRQRLGIAKYGVTVEQSDEKFKAWLQHAYEEALDMAVYLKRAIETFSC
jgi:hypothetical protein